MNNFVRDLASRTGSMGLLIITIVLINAIAAMAYFRIDLTEEQLFTLSPGTQQFLDGLDRDISMKLFRSRSVSGIPLQYQSYGQRVEELLREYVTASGGALSLEVLDPKPDGEEEEWAIKYGLQSAPLGTGESMFLGVVFLMEGEEAVLPFLDPSREQYLEYDVTQALTTLVTPGKKKLGILSSMDVVSPMAGVPPIPGMDIPQSWLFVDELRKSFAVQRIDAEATAIPSDLDLLMVIHPKELSAAALYAIDQFFIRGGRLLVLVDPHSRFEQENAGPQQPGQPGNFGSSLEPLLKAYGIDVPTGKVAADTKLAMRVNTGASGVVPYPVWLSLDADSMNDEMLITAELDSMMLLYAGQIKSTGGSELEFQPLIETTKEGGLIDGFMLQFVAPDMLAKQIKPESEPVVLAALVQGTFTSAYPAGPPADAESAGQHLSQGSSNNSLFVMSDTDFLYDDNAVRKMNFLGQVLAQPLNDNLNFIINVAEFMGGDDALISIRSRGTFSRPFERVQELRQQAQEKWQEEEQKLTEKISAIQERLNSLTSQREGNSFVLSPEQVREIDLAREEMSNAKRARREVRKHLREDIESLHTRLLLVNLLLVPGLLTVWAVGRLWWRRRQS